MNRTAVIISTLLIIVTSGVVGNTAVIGFDRDGVPIATEIVDGTNFLDDDTDSDGISDSAEYNGKTDPGNADTDGDGLGDETEVRGNTDPTRSDTDSDGLSDRDETDGNTDPITPDSDGDGLIDGSEVNGVSDSTLTDTDEDGLNDSREIAIGTSPIAQDSDDDGLDDHWEVKVGTKPAIDQPDRDNDGIPNSREREIGTDPRSVDTDGDLLNDGREVYLGTDPATSDTDGDNLLDGWETAEQTPAGATLPEADPTRMDLYVQVNYVPGVPPKSNELFSKVERDWEEMRVANPDGSTGIHLHIVEKGEMSFSVEYTGSNFMEVYKKYRGKRMGPRKGIYHQIVFMNFSESTNQVGYGIVSGKFAIIRNGKPEKRVRSVMTHELLHNIVGRIQADGRCPNDPHHYCDGGWLESVVTAEDYYLPEELADELERHGFEE